MTYDERREGEDDRKGDLPEGSMVVLVMALLAAILFGAWVAGIIR